MRESSELLSISPAALTKAIQLLEEEVGVKPTVPSGRRIIITGRGRELAKKFKKILNDVAELKEVKALDASSSLRIGSFEVFTTYFLKTLFKEKFQNRKLIPHELVPGSIEDALEAGSIDLGITYIPVPRPGIDFMWGNLN